MQDTVTGRVAFFGRFQSLTVSIRDATETYLELGQRIPIYLNGEIQIAWVLEQGLVDMKFVVRTFGIENIRRDQVVTRGPRFHIAFDANAADKVGQTAQASNLDLGSNSVTNSISGSNAATFRQGATNPLFTDGQLYDSGGPTAEGRYEMMRCKVDSVSLGVMPGRRVAAVRWEGVSEGISYVPQSVQTFKNSEAFQAGGNSIRQPLSFGD